MREEGAAIGSAACAQGTGDRGAVPGSLKIGCLPAFAASTTAASTITSIAESATAATASSATFGLGSSFIHIDGTSAELGAVQSSYSFVSVFVAGHFDKPETARAAGIAIGQNTYTIHLPVALEHLPEFVFVGIEAEIPHKDILHASAPALSCRDLSSVRGLGRSNGLPEILTGAGNSQMRGKYSRDL